MIIWLNGGFGVGKTTVAKIIVRKYPSALLFDPEQVGFMLRRIIPSSHQPSNFQDLPLWRDLTGLTIKGTLELTKSPLVVPMTIVDLRYFEQIIGKLRDDGYAVHHFLLTAAPETLRKRLRRRWWQTPAGRRWCMEQSSRQEESFRSTDTGRKIDTNHHTAQDVADEILAILKLNGTK